MRRAIANAEAARIRASPNPGVGAVIVRDEVVLADGATQSKGGAHAEVDAISGVPPRLLSGSTMYTTLEPCSHDGKTGPCTKAIIDAKIRRVVVGIKDPDANIAGNGIAELRDAGIDVSVGVESDAVQAQLRAYLHHRQAGRPWVVLKLAATLDGRIAAPDGSSSWITGAEARADVHRLRAESDAILVGAGTIRADDPSLTVRDYQPADGDESVTDPRRYVLGAIPDGARVLPATEADGDLHELLDRLAREGVVQLMIEGGAGVAGAFHQAGLVDQYVIYLAPAMLGGDDGVPMFAGNGAPTMADLRRGRFERVTQLGGDLRLDVTLDG
jgi:diaminohydroxyphosphoribosylaminopyrimidine deaminase/5-amino-6-(5-phosphoribosylamino)uracil reductase